MQNTPLDYQIVTETIESMRLGDFSGATIRDIASLAGTLEKKTGQPFIHLEMGVPGLKPSQIGMDAEKKALDGYRCYRQWRADGLRRYTTDRSHESNKNPW